MKIPLLYIITFLTTNLFAQHKAFVVDEETRMPLAYVHVILDSIHTYSKTSGEILVNEYTENLQLLYVGYKTMRLELPLLNDTIFLTKLVNELEQVVVTGVNDSNFTLGKMQKKHDGIFSNGAINGPIFHYYEIRKDFDIPCSLFRLNRLKINLSQKNKSPYRINFYTNEDYLFDDAIVINEKQKKGINEITINKVFNTTTLGIGFEWLPEEHYKTISDKLESGDTLTLTEFGLGYSENIKYENQSYRFSPITKFKKYANNHGLLLELDCDCLN